MPPRKRPTIHDVAAAAGVSRGTVSRALNGDKYVSSAAYAAIQRAVAEIGYVANRSARTLKSQRTGSVAFVLSEPQEKFFEDPNFPVLLRTATQALAERDVTLILMIADSADSRDRVVRFLRGGHVDGVLLVSTHYGDPIIGEIERDGIPAVAAGEIIGHERTIPYAGADERLGARMMAEYLVAQGRRKIGMITGPLDTPGGLKRFEGFCDVLGRKATKKLIAHGDYTRASGEAAMAELLERTPDLDAVFVGSDLMAAGALTALRAAGRDVPGDVAVAGFDDSPVAVSTHPALTTMRQPLAQVARETVRLLLDLVEGGGPVAPVVLPTELVVRESS